MPALLSFGFRPFFVLACVQAMVAPLLWLCALDGVTWPGAPSDLLHWHAHEMLVGFVGAAMAGFLLTAVPNFTGREPVSGAPLVWLSAAWLFARIAGTFAGDRVWPVAAADLAFAGTLLVLIARDIVGSGNRRNFVLVGIVGVWGAAGLAHDLRVAGAASMLLHVEIVLVAIIAGRIVPAFTGNWMRSRGLAPLPAGSARLDVAAIACVVIAAGFDLVAEGGAVAAAVFALSALVHWYRLSLWRTARTLPEPLVWSLHLAYAWIPAGYTLLAFAAVGAGGMPRAAAVHALAVGALGSMILAVMSRVSLGHTGRALSAAPAMAIAYLAISAAALARIAAYAVPGRYMALLVLAGVAWIGAFALFAWRHGPMFFAPRVDQSAT